MHKEITLLLDGDSLDPLNLYQKVRESFHENKKISIDIPPTSLERVKKARLFVEDILKSNKAYYGINTGFGALAETKISANELEELQLNLVRSHCCGVGDLLPLEISFTMMIIRLNCLLQGHSGVRLEVIEQLKFFIEEKIIPLIPRQGSVGASGDLAPLAHLALTLIGEGEVFFQNKNHPTQNILKQLKRDPLVLKAKEGLALINGTTAMCALLTNAVGELTHLQKLMDITAAFSVEALRGSHSPFDEKISLLRKHTEQSKVAFNLRTCLEGSQIRESHKDCKKVQDPYSLRCIPQVHGACRQSITHAYTVLKNEINAVTDNPLIFPDTKEIISGGNFHGEILAFISDYLALAICEFGSLSERRVDKMMITHFSDLPPFLTKKAGPNSGLMMAHVTHAALTSENKSMSFPRSVDSISTSADKEDHVSMGMNAALRLNVMLENLKNSISIEILCAAQAIFLLRPLKTSKKLELFYSEIRKAAPPIEEDRVFSYDIKNIKENVVEKSRDFLLREKIV